MPQPARPTAPPDPLRLDVAALCRHGQHLQGQWPQPTLQRLTVDLQPRPGDLPPADVAWAATGSLRPRGGAEPELWLHLRADTVVALQCQRCLQPMTEALAVDRRLRFVQGEDEAARLDEESDDDVLALPARLDLRELVEDELILALPLVPRHDTCPQPLLVPVPAPPSGDAARPAGAAAPLDDEPAPHPFAALAALRRGRGGPPDADEGDAGA